MNYADWGHQRSNELCKDHGHTSTRCEYRSKFKKIKLFFDIENQFNNKWLTFNRLSVMVIVDESIFILSHVDLSSAISRMNSFSNFPTFGFK
jgi:hypothetical protein